MEIKIDNNLLKYVPVSLGKAIYFPNARSNTSAFQADSFRGDCSPVSFSGGGVLPFRALHRDEANIRDTLDVLTDQSLPRTDRTRVRLSGTPGGGQKKGLRPRNRPVFAYPSISRHAIRPRWRMHWARLPNKLQAGRRRSSRGKVRKPRGGA